MCKKRCKKRSFWCLLEYLDVFSRSVSEFVLLQLSVEFSVVLVDVLTFKVTNIVNHNDLTVHLMLATVYSTHVICSQAHFYSHILPFPTKKLWIWCCCGFWCQHQLSVSERLYRSALYKFIFIVHKTRNVGLLDALHSTGGPGMMQ